MNATPRRCAPAAPFLAPQAADGRAGARGALIADLDADGARDVVIANRYAGTWCDWLGDDRALAPRARAGGRLPPHGASTLNLAVQG
jgi:hypothetical protein